jgi:hypothetical protein
LLRRNHEGVGKTAEPTHRPLAWFGIGGGSSTFVPYSRSDHPMRTPWMVPAAWNRTVSLLGGVIVILKLPDKVPSALAT